MEMKKINLNAMIKMKKEFIKLENDLENINFNFDDYDDYEGAKEKFDELSSKINQEMEECVKTIAKKLENDNPYFYVEAQIGDSGSCGFYFIPFEHVSANYGILKQNVWNGTYHDGIAVNIEDEEIDYDEYKRYLEDKAEIDTLNLEN